MAMFAGTDSVRGDTVDEQGEPIVGDITVST